MAMCDRCVQTMPRVMVHRKHWHIHLFVQWALKPNESNLTNHGCNSQWQWQCQANNRMALWLSLAPNAVTIWDLASLGPSYSYFALSLDPAIGFVMLIKTVWHTASARHYLLYATCDLWSDFIPSGPQVLFPMCECDKYSQLLVLYFC